MAALLWVALLAAPHGSRAQPPADWRDITPAASVSASMGEALPDGFTPRALCDGSVAATSRVVGHANLNAQFGMRFAWSAFESRWEWPAPQAVAAVDLYVADPTTAHAAPVCVKLRAQDERGHYTIRLIHNEYLSWQPASDWTDSVDPAARAQTVRLQLRRPFLTTGLQIIVGHHQRWVELGDVRLWSAPVAPALPVPPTAEAIRCWFADPWAGTEGGARLPDAEGPAVPWSLRMCRNDTEQAIIGLLNEGDADGAITVSVSGAPPGLQAELLAVGAIEARGTPQEWWAPGKSHVALMNLLTAEGVRGFAGYFPAHFVAPESWERFPTLVLAPGKPAYVWLRLTTLGETLARPGTYHLTFTAGALRRDIAVEVLNVRLPAEPVVESIAYGSVSDADSRLHHTTVNGGYRRFVTCNLVVHMNRWGTDFVKLAQDDPEGFRQLVRQGVDDLYRDLIGRGYRKDQILIEIWDEPNDANIESWLLIAREIKAYDPTALVYANPPEDWEGHPCTLEKTVRPMAPYVDVWAPHLNLINRFPETLACMKATGKPIWFYQNVGLAYSRNEGSGTAWYRTAPWQALRHNLQGVGFWSAAGYYGDPWDDFDRDPYTDWPDAAVVFADEAGGAIGTRNWEAWREGIEDVAIGRMLALALDEGRLSEADRAPARRWLAETPDRVIRESRAEAAVEARALALAWLDAAQDDGQWPEE